MTIHIISIYTFDARKNKERLESLPFGTRESANGMFDTLTNEWRRFIPQDAMPFSLRVDNCANNPSFLDRSWRLELLNEGKIFFITLKTCTFVPSQRR